MTLFLVSDCTMKPAHLVLTIDSGGQPNFMDAARLFLRNNSLYLLTIKLDERLDEKPKFNFFINGKPISMCSTAILTIKLDERLDEKPKFNFFN